MSLVERLKRWSRTLRRDAHALWIAARDPRTPLAAKVVGGAVAAYAFSPIDLIPDFVPLLGWLDDLLIVPAGLWLAVRLIPPALFAEHRMLADVAIAKPISRAGAAIVVGVWLVAAACVAASIWAWRYW